MNERPTGVTVLGILNIIGGALSLLSGIAFVLMGPMFQSIIMSSSAGMRGMHGYNIFPLFAYLGVAYIIAGVISILIGYGLLKGMKWSWWIEIIFSALGLVGFISMLVLGIIPAIIPLAINGLIIYYLLQPHVKYYFGFDIS